MEIDSGSRTWDIFRISHSCCHPNVCQRMLGGGKSQQRGHHIGGDESNLIRTVHAGNPIRQPADFATNGDSTIPPKSSGNLPNRRRIHPEYYLSSASQKCSATNHFHEQDCDPVLTIMMASPSSRNPNGTHVRPCTTNKDDAAIADPAQLLDDPTVAAFMKKRRDKSTSRSLSQVRSKSTPRPSSQKSNRHSSRSPPRHRVTFTPSVVGYDQIKDETLLASQEVHTLEADEEDAVRLNKEAVEEEQTQDQEENEEKEHTVVIRPWSVVKLLLTFLSLGFFLSGSSLLAGYGLSSRAPP